MAMTLPPDDDDDRIDRESARTGSSEHANQEVFEEMPARTIERHAELLKRLE
ncbi:hypothetical protein [Nocardia anaemiae]|uniref:hypothetical protein n=1 Tax=Nocardia anaemiae TaxID=263910 RepID=UPI001C3FDA92|nr:hypothetical protein [Nocardia anaemiae]